MPSRNMNIFRSLNDNGRLQFMAGGHVTTEKIWQVAENKKGLVGWWVAKIRGIVISSSGQWKFETEEEARRFGQKVLREWKQELRGSNK